MSIIWNVLKVWLMRSIVQLLVSWLLLLIDALFSDFEGIRVGCVFNS
jgi:hypothetical protein